jgi:hypothetical protein
MFGRCDFIAKARLRHNKNPRAEACATEAKDRLVAAMPKLRYRFWWSRGCLI